MDLTFSGKSKKSSGKKSSGKKILQLLCTVFLCCISSGRADDNIWARFLECSEQNSYVRYQRFTSRITNLFLGANKEDSLFNNIFHQNAEDLIRAINFEESNINAHTDSELTVFAKGAANIHHFSSVFSRLGIHVLNELQKKSIDTSFLEQPFPVEFRYMSHPGKIEKFDQFLEKDISFDSGRDNAVRMNFAIALADVSCVSSVDWMDIMRLALSSLSKEVECPLDFTKTPFFCHILDKELAVDIARETLFFDHPSTMYLTHGTFSHAIQILHGFAGNTLNKRKFNTLFKPYGDHTEHKTQWDVIIDPPESYIQAIMFTPVNHQCYTPVNYEGLLNGRVPDTIHLVLSGGLVSKSYQKVLDEVKDFEVEGIIANRFLERSDVDAKEQLAKHIRNIRALEYAVAGANMLLLDQLAKDYEFEGPSELLDAFGDKWCWCGFPDKEEYTAEATIFYLGEKQNLRAVHKKIALRWLLDGKDVYVQEEKGQSIKLRKIENIQELRDKSFVLYPKGVAPPSELLVK